MERNKKKSGWNLQPTVELAPLPVAVPVCQAKPASWWIDDCIKEEGKTLMCYNDNYASASANVTTVQSDTATQRDYLLSRLAKADYPKHQELANLFNLYVDNTPKTYKELIDIIKNDKFTIDKKVEKALELNEETSDEERWYWGPTHGIIWAGVQPDRDGYNTAEKEKGKQFTAARDIIMTGDAAAGLKALQDFEAWLPVGKSN